MARTLGLVVETLIPFELAHQLEQAFLLPTRDELFKRLSDRGLFRALPKCGGFSTSLIVAPEVARLMSAKPRFHWAHVAL